MMGRGPRRGRMGGARGALLAGFGAIVAVSVGCSDDKLVPPRLIVSPVPTYTLEELRAAPEDLKVGGIVFAVEAELWRDFMPFGPPDGKPLVAYVEATAVGEPAFPDEITAVYLWVLNGDQVWSARMEYDPAIPRPPGSRTYVAREGPKWGPAIDVEVTVGFRPSGGNVHLVRIPSVPIQRSD